MKVDRACSTRTRKAPLPVFRGSGAAPSLPVSPGQEVRGEVLADQLNGRFLVRVAGELLDMNLPGEIKPGETVNLTFVTDQPRLTFVFSRSGGDAAPVSLSNTARWLGLARRILLLVEHGAEALIHCGDLTSADIAKSGAHCDFFPCDVSRSADAEAAIQAVVSKFGAIDILISNAGIQDYGDVVTTTEAAWDSMTDLFQKSSEAA